MSKPYDPMSEPTAWDYTRTILYILAAVGLLLCLLAR